MSTPRFLADENIERAFVDGTLRLAPGMEFVTVQDLGLAGMEDTDLLEFAKQQSWILVSHDVSTLKPLAEQLIHDGEEIAGLLILSVGRRSVREVAESLAIIAAASEAEEWTNRIVYLPL